VISKLLSNESQFPPMYFIYLMKNGIIRLLIDYNNAPIVIALAASLVSEKDCKLREDR
jgi:phosphate starvation-inducible membrane PsiE